MYVEKNFKRISREWNKLHNFPSHEPGSMKIPDKSGGPHVISLIIVRAFVAALFNTFSDSISSRVSWVAKQAALSSSTRPWQRPPNFSMPRFISIFGTLLNVPKRET